MGPARRSQPFFDALELKGGGEAITAARTVLQTGDHDFAYGLNAVEDDLLRRLEAGGKGRVAVEQGGDVEVLSLNASDPWTEVKGERGHLKSRHPAFCDKAVRRALALLVDRKGIVDVILGRAGMVTANFLNAPARLRSPNMTFEFNIDKANQVLDDAGWKKGADGVRAKAGIELELKAVTPVVFFGSDVTNADTMQKFWADMMWVANVMTSPEPQLVLAIHRTDRIPQKANKWLGSNRVRWQNAEYDALHNALQREFDPVKRAALAIQMNDLVVSDGHVIPLYVRSRVSGVGNKLEPVLSVWDNELWALGYWTRGS